MRTGVRVALDLGKARVGVARCDATATLASPYAVWPFTDVADLVARTRDLVAELAPLELLIGLPIDLRGESGLAADTVRQTAIVIAQGVAQTPVRLVDERLTTAAARKLLQAAGHNSRSDRQLIDAAAATVLLEDALEAERRQATPPGELVT